MALSDRDLLQITKLIQNQVKADALQFKIVQEMPIIFEKNTVYFHQVSTGPRLFQFYHTDKDGDLATISLPQEILDEINSTIDSANLAAENALSGIKGKATQTNAPTSTTEFQRWIVSTPLTLPNSWGFEVTQAELDDNFIFFNVTNGVIEKDPSKKPEVDLATVLSPVSITKAETGKSVSDYVYNESDKIVSDKFDLVLPPTETVYSDEAFNGVSDFPITASRAFTNIFNRATKDGNLTKIKIECAVVGDATVVVGTLANLVDGRFFIRKEIGTYTLTLGINEITVDEPILKDEYVALTQNTAVVKYNKITTSGNRYITPYTIASQAWTSGAINRPLAFGITIYYPYEGPLKTKLDARYLKLEDVNFADKKTLTQVDVSKEIGGNNAVQNALDLITDNSPNKRYQINVANGIYEIFNASSFLGNPTYPAMICPKDHVDIVGTSKSSTILSAELPYSDGSIDSALLREKFQTIYNWADDVLIKNITFLGKNLRYVLHQDNNQEANGTRTYENCDFIFRGNKGFTRALGIGTYTGSKTYVIGGKSVSPARSSFSIHNNRGFTKPSLWSFRNHAFVNGSGATDYSCIIASNSGSMQDCTLEFIGCTFNQSKLFVYEEYWLYQVNLNDCFNHANFRITGYGNEPLFFQNTVLGKSLMIKSLSTGLASKVRVDITSSAYTSIFANPYNYYGNLGNPDRQIVDKYIIQDGALTTSGYAIGGKSIFEGIYHNGVVSEDTLGKRLGDCSTVNKLLKVTIDGTLYTITFDKNYTFISNASIIVEINAIIGTVGIASEYNIGGDYHAEFTDVLNICTNASASAFIPKGTLVTRKNNRISVCGENDALFGLLIDDCSPYRLDAEGVNFGKGRVVKNAYVTIENGKVQSVNNSGTGSRYKIVSGAFVADFNGGYILEENKYILI